MFCLDVNAQTSPPKIAQPLSISSVIASPTSRRFHASSLLEDIIALFLTDSEKVMEMSYKKILLLPSIVVCVA